jgi:hypothetical protein
MGLGPQNGPMNMNQEREWRRQIDETLL